MDNDLRREIILDNYNNPYHKETKDDTYLSANANNVSCIDNITLYLKIDNNIIIDAYFDGEACAISTASTSIMLKRIIGMDLNEAIKYIKSFNNMIYENDYDKEYMGEALVFDQICYQESRKTCATLPYRALEKIIIENNN